MDNDLEWPSIEQAVQGQVGQMVKQGMDVRTGDSVNLTWLLDFDRQLLNVLDPFLRIPIELTSTDRYLLHLSKNILNSAKFALLNVIQAYLKQHQPTGEPPGFQSTK